MSTSTITLTGKSYRIGQSTWTLWGETPEDFQPALVKLMAGDYGTSPPKSQAIYLGKRYAFRAAVGRPVTIPATRLGQPIGDA